jgi:hypothetical protein
MLNTPAHIPADTPPDAKSPYAIYTKAVERDFRREKRWKFFMLLFAILAVIGVGLGAYSAVISTATNLELVKVAQMQPVRYVERGPDGMDRVIAIRNTMDVNVGREMETLQWFVTWSRWISGEKAVNEFNRANARAKLAGSDAITAWDALQAADVDADKGYRRDVTGVVVAAQEVPGMPEGSRLYTLQWQEKTLHNGKIVKNETLMQNITITSGPPREGALDGVNITILTEPTVSFKQRDMNRR